MQRRSRHGSGVLLDSVKDRVGALAEKLDPRRLDERILLGGLRELQKAGERRLQTLLKPLVREPSPIVDARCAWASGNMSG